MMAWRTWRAEGRKSPRRAVDRCKCRKTVHVTDLMKMQESWGPTTENGEVHNTINILKVELGKESPESWARIRKKLVEHVEEETL